MDAPLHVDCLVLAGIRKVRGTGRVFGIMRNKNIENTTDDVEPNSNVRYRAVSFWYSGGVSRVQNTRMSDQLADTHR